MYWFMLEMGWRSNFTSGTPHSSGSTTVTTEILDIYTLWLLLFSRKNINFVKESLGENTRSDERNNHKKQESFHLVFSTFHVYLKVLQISMCSVLEDFCRILYVRTPGHFLIFLAFHVVFPKFCFHNLLTTDRILKIGKL